MEGGSPLLGLPMRPGEEFTLHYIHSVDQEPIWEVHSVGPDGTIYIEEEILVMFGAGMGELPGRGRLTGRGDLQVIEDMHDAIGEFVLRVGRPGVDHTIWWRDEKFNLTRIAAGRAVRVRARQINLLRRIALALCGPRIAPGLDEKQNVQSRVSGRI